jgi:hypothetical protein
MSCRLYFLCLCLSVFPVGASASFIGFDDGNTSVTQPQVGTLSYGGSGGVLTGEGIDIYNVYGDGTPSNDGVGLDCVGCKLEFTTGNNVSEGPSIWEFAGGGSITITGEVKQGSTTIANGTLVDGSFSEAFITADGTEDGVLIMSGFGTDEKDTNLLDFFGLPDLQYTFGVTNISLGSVAYTGSGGFIGDVTNADFDNLVVPIPASVWLFGSGLIGLVGIARRKNSV